MWFHWNQSGALQSIFFFFFCNSYVCKYSGSMSSWEVFIYKLGSHICCVDLTQWSISLLFLLLLLLIAFSFTHSYFITHAPNWRAKDALSIYFIILGLPQRMMGNVVLWHNEYYSCTTGLYQQNTKYTNTHWTLFRLNAIGWFYISLESKVPWLL